MKVLVTGGAGFIGSHLVDSLVFRGDEVTVLDNLRTGRRENIPRDARLIAGDINDEFVLQDVIAHAEVVFHLAAISSVQNSIDEPIATDRTNALGTLNVLMAASKAGVRRVIVASSSSVYGATSLLPTPESAPTNPQSPYAASKLAAESHTSVAHNLRGLETVVLRYFNVYGARQNQSSPYSAVIPLFIDALVANKAITIYGDGQQSRDFVHVHDVVQANLLAALAPLSSTNSTYNVGSGEQYTLLQLIDSIAKILKAIPEIRYCPSRPGDIRTSWADISAIVKELDYRPTVSLENGLIEMVTAVQLDARHH